MQKTNIIALLFMACSPFGSHIQAQSWVKKASKSVFVLKTFRADGQLLGSATGFYTDSEGRALSSFTPFKGATRAVVIDAQGKEYPVEAIIGANATYDVAKFRVQTKKSEPLTVAQQPAVAGSKAWLLTYRETKNVPQGTIRRVETFAGQHSYYSVALPVGESMVSSPLLNEDGEVIGLAQLAATTTDTLSYAVSALFADSLHTTGLSLNDEALRSTAIKKALPEQRDQALLMLYMAAGTADSATYVTLVDDFITQFPDAPDGYTYRARMAAANDRCDDAARDMEKAIGVAANKDEAHYSYAQLIYQKVMFKPEPP